MKQAHKKNRQAMRQGMEAMAMTAAMPLAALITLNHRLPILLNAMTNDDAKDGPELQRMTEEKVQTAGQMALALGGAAAAGQQALLAYALDQAEATARLLTNPPLRQDEMLATAQQSTTRLARLAATLGEIGSRSVAAALRPAHRKVTANARRLASRNRKRP